MRKTGDRKWTRRLALALILGTASAGMVACGARQAPGTGDAESVAEIATFIGSYTCDASTWAIRMRVVLLGDQSALGTATVSSTSPPEVLASWGLEGTWAAGGVVVLPTTHAIDVPAGFKPLGFEGKLSAAGFEGVAIAADCTVLHLEGVAEAPS